MVSELKLSLFNDMLDKKRRGLLTVCHWSRIQSYLIAFTH